MSSGTAFKSLISSSGDLDCSSGYFLQRGVEVVDISGVMLTVMDLHRLLVDSGFERVMGYGRGGSSCAMCDSPCPIGLWLSPARALVKPGWAVAEKRRFALFILSSPAAGNTRQI
jgi:hypothetical protein